MKHEVLNCPTLLIVSEMFSKQANAIGAFKQGSNNSPYNMYDLGWKNH